MADKDTQRALAEAQQQLLVTQHAIAALSARMMALESLLAAVIANAGMSGEQRSAALGDYQAAWRETVDRCQAQPIAEVTIDLVEQAFAEVAELVR